MRVSGKTGAPAPPTTVGVSPSLQSEPVPTAPVALSLPWCRRGVLNYLLLMN